MSVETGRANQRRRTRKDLLQAAARLMKQGRAPTLEEVASEAMVSRATAYRYFPNVETLLIEAPLEVAMRSPDEALRDAPPLDPLARLERVEEMFQQMAGENEPALRMMIANATQRPLREEGELPARQNRRLPLIEAALAPARKQFKPGEYERLCRALSLVMFTEAWLVFKDVLQVDAEEARETQRFAIKALLEAAKR
jgi:AcrR family transcriptional regulator